MTRPRAFPLVRVGLARKAGYAILTRSSQSVNREAMNVDRIDLTAPELRRRAAKYAALADPARLAIVDALWVSDLSPSELQARLGIASNLLAHHIKVLESEGILARSRSEGDRRRTYLRLARQSLEGVIPPGTIPEWHLPRGRMVFVGTANTSRSHLAAALWERFSRVPVESAGTHPADRVDPRAIATARRHGLTLRGREPQSLADVATAEDVFVTVCDNAHEELRSPAVAHWSIPDPVRLGTDAAFDAAFEALTQRVTHLASHMPQHASRRQELGA